MAILAKIGPMMDWPPLPPNTCRAAQLTATGRSAVATVCVDGAGAVAAVSQFFRPAVGVPISKQAERRIVFGWWGGRAEPEEGAGSGPELKVGTESPISAGSHSATPWSVTHRSINRGEEVVVCRHGPQLVYIHCHGGIAAAAAILSDLQQIGVQIVAAIELASNPYDPYAMELMADLAAAPTERTARILLDQWHGALQNELAEIVTQVVRGQRARAIDQTESLLATTAIGRHLVQPWKVVLAGRPNAGKSSLINALAGYQRSIVFAQPGTTRDVVTTSIALDGWPIQLTDTAGIHDSDDALERRGIELAQAAVCAADLAVVVVDGSSVELSHPFGGSAVDHQFAWTELNSNTLFVRNKHDLYEFHADPLSKHLVAADYLRTSAVTNFGVDDLATAIVRRLVPVTWQSGSPILFRNRHVELVATALASLKAGKCEEACETLSQLVQLATPIRQSLRIGQVSNS